MALLTTVFRASLLVLHSKNLRFKIKNRKFQKVNVKFFLFPFALCLLFFSFSPLLNAQNQSKPDVFQKANNAANKVNNVIAVFQPFLLKARQIYCDSKQLINNTKANADATFNPNGNIQNTGVNGGFNTNGNTTSATTIDSNSASTVNNNSSSTSNTYTESSAQGSAATNTNTPAQSNYLPNQSLPVNNTSTINSDGTGNLGNQNNGIYGNCLDALAGTVLGMGEASQNPTSVDLMFFAPADGQNTYYLMTPNFARTASYMTEHVSDQVLQWRDVNETEVALTKLSVGQFDQIQNSNQVLNAVLNAQDFAGYYSSVGQKLDGQVFAIKSQMENRSVCTLMAIYKHVGTSGSNGYLKIKVKSQGLGNAANGQINTSAYMR